MRRRKKFLIVFFIIIVLIIFLAMASIFHYERISYEIDKAVYRLSGMMGWIEEGIPDITIVEGKKGFTARFPDVCKCRNDLLMVYYWNQIHAPLELGDSLGNIMAVRGTIDAKSWGEPTTIITEKTLIDWGLGVWSDNSGNICFSQNEADKNATTFCVEARDPNLHYMADGKLLLTFFTRLLRTESDSLQSKFYTYGDTYICCSINDGYTWSRPEKIESELLNAGCAKRGNIAEFPNGDLFIPLYGYNSEYPHTFTTTAVRVRFDNDRLIVLDEYSDPIFGDSIGLFPDGDTEVSFLYFNDNIYAFCRRSGIFSVSTDEGRTWSKLHSFHNDEDRNIMQPYIIPIDGERILINWTERIAPENRAIFGKIYAECHTWNEYPDVLIFSDKYGVDMGDPSTLLMEDGRVLTVFYDSGIGIIGGMINEIEKFE